MDKRNAQPLGCSFCGKSATEVRKLIAGQAPTCICDQCVVLCNDIVAGKIDREEQQGTKLRLRPPDEQAPCCCSFCGKPERDANKLIVAPTAGICGDCIRLCNDIMAL